MLDKTTKEKLIQKATLIFYGLPIGANAPHDAPIVGNKSLAQIVMNRIESTTKNAEEFKYMHSVIMQFLKETKGKVVNKIKLDNTNQILVRKGFTDSNGFIIKSDKKIY